MHPSTPPCSSPFQLFHLVALCFVFHGITSVSVTRAKNAGHILLPLSTYTTQVFSPMPYEFFHFPCPAVCISLGLETAFMPTLFVSNQLSLVSSLYMIFNLTTLYYLRYIISSFVNYKLRLGLTFYTVSHLSKDLAYCFACSNEHKPINFQFMTLMM